MKKNRFIKVLTFTFAICVASSITAVQANAMAPKKQVTINNVVAADENEKQAAEAVLALYTDNTFTTIKDSTTQEDIFNAHKLVDKLSESELKDLLKIYVLKAQIQFFERKATAQVYALYKDEAHTIITDDLTQKQIAIARASVENLPAESLRVQLRVLVIFAQVQLDAREATYGLFTDDSHTTIKADLKQADIDKAKELVDSLIDEWSIKAELNALIVLAQKQFDEKNSAINPQLTEAEKMVYALYTDGSFSKLAPGVTRANIQYVRDIVKLLYPTELNRYLMYLLDKADRLLDEASSYENFK